MSAVVGIIVPAMIGIKSYSSAHKENARGLPKANGWIGWIALAVILIGGTLETLFISGALNWIGLILETGLTWVFAGFAGEYFGGYMLTGKKPKGYSFFFAIAAVVWVVTELLGAVYKVAGSTPDVYSLMCLAAMGVVFIGAITQSLAVRKSKQQRWEESIDTQFEEWMKSRKEGK